MWGGGGGWQGGRQTFRWLKTDRNPRPSINSKWFFTLKTNSTAKLRIELKNALLEMHSNKIKGTYIKLVHLWSSFTFSHRHWRKLWVDYWGGVKVYYVAPPPTPHPLPTPICYMFHDFATTGCQWNWPVISNLALVPFLEEGCHEGSFPVIRNLFISLDS